MINNRAFSLLLLLLCTSCSYHFEEQPRFLADCKTLSMPHVKGDWDGSLTAAIIEEIARAGSYTYQRSGGAVTLLVELMEMDDRNIGFRYDRNREGKLRDTVIPTETRLTTSVTVSLTDASGSTLLGPVCLTASVDFDHDYESPLHMINIFSLGQLNDYDAACDAVSRPLNRILAQKIVDFISNSW